MNHLKKWIALLLIPALLLAGSFAAAESQPEQGGALGGSPWINSTLAGNLPGKAPAAVDDFYLSVNYDELQQFIDDNDIAFSLSFGPILVDNYETKYHYDGWYPVAEVNNGYSRAGIGQLDERHYLYMSLNHSSEKEARWTMMEFAEFFQSRGVRCAYAFDGGQTSEIIFNHEIYNYIDRNSERWVSDMIWFGTALPEEVWKNG